MGKKLSKNEFIQKLEEKNKNYSEYEVIDFIDTKKPVLVYHKKCKNTLKLSPASLLRGGGCSICSGNQKRSTEDWNKIISEIPGYSVIGTKSILYNKTRMVQLEVKHHDCGKVFNVLPHNILKNKTRCPFCKHGSKHAAKILFEELLEKEPEYSTDSTYMNCKTKLLFKHSKCNSEFFMTPDHFKRGERCPLCSVSKGERLIADILRKNNIDFEQQYSFKNLKDIKPLRFDFMVGECLIEYDGVQHDEPIIYSNNYILSREKFYIMKRHDLKKNIYCSKNKIPLLRISYRDINNIETIVNKFLMFLSEDHTNLYEEFTCWQRDGLKKEK